MIGIKTIVHRLQDVKPRDLASGIQFLFALPCAAVFKRKHKDLWLICEDEFEARDNGYFFTGIWSGSIRSRKQSMRSIKNHLIIEK